MLLGTLCQEKCRMLFRYSKIAISLLIVVHGINSYAKQKEEMFVNDSNGVSFDALAIKVQQQEETITQLLVIVAATNRKLSDLIEAQNQSIHTLNHF